MAFYEAFSISASGRGVSSCRGRINSSERGKKDKRTPVAAPSSGKKSSRECAWETGLHVLTKSIGIYIVL